MSHETDLTAFHYIEGSNPRLNYTLKDENDQIITAPLISQIASIYEEITLKKLPTWEDLDIDSAEGNLVTNGVGIWVLPITATVKVTTDNFEIQIIKMEFTYGSPAKTGIHRMKVKVFKDPALVA